MSNQYPGGGQPQQPPLSPDGRFWWNGTEWVPVQQPQAQQPQPQQPQFQAAPQPQQPQFQAPQPPYGAGYPPAALPPKKGGLPTWAKVLIGLLAAIVALMVLLTVVGLLVDSDDYSSWSCEDVAKKAVDISSDKNALLVLEGVTDLSIDEDNRDGFTPPDSGRGLVLSCTGTGQWNELDDTPVKVRLEANADGDTYVGYELAS